MLLHEFLEFLQSISRTIRIMNEVEDRRCGGFVTGKKKEDDSQLREIHMYVHSKAIARILTNLTVKLEVSNLKTMLH